MNLLLYPKQVEELRALVTKLKELTENTTPGEWITDGEEIQVKDSYHPRFGDTMIAGGFDYLPGGIFHEEDAKFIVDAHNELPTIVQRLTDMLSW